MRGAGEGEKRRGGRPAWHISHPEATAVGDINSHLAVPSGPAANGQIEDAYLGLHIVSNNLQYCGIT